ncbi:YozE family protein [Sphingomonas sp.]|uniref:YozE family protein n=1 Tax=Sphingomonas sp. TaxID=28214 RepID=UPI003AFF65E6
MTNEHGETFAEWLLAQKGREGSIGELVAAAKGDPKFPRRSDPDEVRARLNEMQADGDMHGVVDDAETDWLSY